MAYWDTATQAPSTYGKGFWSVARNLYLRQYGDGLRLVQEPLEALKTLRGKPFSMKKVLTPGVTDVKTIGAYANVYEAEVDFDCHKGDVFGLNLCVGEGRKVKVQYDVDEQMLLIDRTNCSKEKIAKFDRMSHAKVSCPNDKLHLRIFVDKSSVEIFANDGRDVFTLCTYPAETQTGLQLFSLQKGTAVNLTAWPLESIWK